MKTLVLHQYTDEELETMKKEWVELGFKLGRSAKAKKEWLSTTEAEQYTGVTSCTLNKWMKVPGSPIETNKIKGKGIKYLASSLDDHMQGKRIKIKIV